MDKDTLDASDKLQEAACSQVDNLVGLGSLGAADSPDMDNPADSPEACSPAVDTLEAGQTADRSPAATESWHSVGAAAHSTSVAWAECWAGVAADYPWLTGCERCLLVPV